LLSDVNGGWATLGLHSEGLLRCSAFLEVLAEEHRPLRARAYTLAAWLAGRSNLESHSAEMADAALEHARGGVPPEIWASALVAFARIATRQQRFDDAQAALIEAEAIKPGFEGSTAGGSICAGHLGCA
jgi:hypothetical protein